MFLILPLKKGLIILIYILKSINPKMTEEEKMASKRESARKWREKNKEQNFDKLSEYQKEYQLLNKKILNITPLSSAKTEEDIIRLNHYTNLQPLCSKVNREIKKDKLINEII